MKSKLKSRPKYELIKGDPIELLKTIKAGDKENIKVTLRLETFKNGTTVKTDVEASGMASKLPEIAAAAWGKLLTKSGLADDGSKAPSADPARSLQEGRRLMREADWLHAMKADPATYLPLIESAIALGIPSKESILIHLDGCFREVLSLRSEQESSWTPPTTVCRPVVTGCSMPWTSCTYMMPIPSW